MKTRRDKAFVSEALFSIKTEKPDPILTKFAKPLKIQIQNCETLLTTEVSPSKCCAIRLDHNP